MRRTPALATVLALILGAPLAAQGTPPRAPVWRAAFDSGSAPDSSAIDPMPPGWHLGGEHGRVLYDPALMRDGEFRVQSELYLFSSTPGTGVGLVVGGDGLDGAAGKYAALVVGPDARYRIVRRDGAAVRDLVPWTAHTAITRHPGGQANVKQTLAIAAVGDTVRFEVNGALLAALPRDVVRPAGMVGLRADPGVNVHVATLEIDGNNVAPRPAPKP